MQKLIFVFSLAAVLNLPFLALAQQSGCTDPRATNFTPTAVINDGSCSYPITNFNPPFAFELPNVVRETSGLVMINGKLITFNDSGGSATLFAVDTSTAQVVQQITISNATNIDWEDIALDDDFIYIGDFGNNSGAREDLVIYRLNRSDFPQSGHATMQAERIDFSYPDQQVFNRSKNHNFDCEAMIATNDSIYLFSKNRQDGKSKLYSLPNKPGTYVASLLDEFDVRGLITGADIQPYSAAVVLTGYTQNSYMPFIWLLFDYHENSFFSGNKRRIELVNLVTTQVEGVSYTSNKNLMISAEKSPTFSARVFRLNIADWTDPINALADNFKKQLEQLEIVGNPSSDDILRFKINNRKGTALRADVFDSTGALVKTLKPLIIESGELAEISIADLTSGLYYITVFSRRRAFTASFIKL